MFKRIRLFNPPSISLPQIVKKAVQSETPFEELWSSDKTRVLKYIEKNNLHFSILTERGYDILKKAFFAFRFELVEGECKIVKHNFTDFGEFFAFVGGDIYERSCFYGYNFSKKEIKKYSIKCSKINFDAFISSQFSNCEERKEIQEQTQLLKQKKRLDHSALMQSVIHKLSTWFQKISPITSPDNLISKYKHFNTLLKTDSGVLYNYNSEDIFFSLMLQKNKEELEKHLPFILSPASPFSSQSRISTGILFHYGEDATKALLQQCRDANNVALHPVYRETLKKIQKKVDKILSPSNRIVRRGFFSECDYMYCISYDVYQDQALIHCGIYTDYYLSFERFACEMGAELSSCDLKNAPLTTNETEKYNIELPAVSLSSKDYASFALKKQYRNNKFHVSVKFFDSQGEVVDEVNSEFDWFFDFVHYLKGDLSNADLIMCDGIENIDGLTDLKIDGLKVRSEVAKHLHLPLNLIPNEPHNLISFDETEQNENDSCAVEQTMHESDGDYANPVAYVTDLHLLHRFTAYHCETNEDRHFVLRKIARTIKNDCSRICLIGGDISSNYSIYQLFVSYLASYQTPDRLIKPTLFFTIGNHELWSFPDNPLDETISCYRSILQEKGFHLVHNNLFYCVDASAANGDCWLELPSDELEMISENELREKMRDAYLIIFGGMGFAGNNTTFNANQGIYRSAVNREQEIRECEKFNELHRKVSRALYDKNVIVFIHMPIDDWLLDQKTTDRFVYVNGHRHINKYYDDGIKRIYADNQIGYKRKEVALKHFSINMDYDWFSDYPDGIHEITADDYRFFYRGINQGIDFNRDFSKIYMLKREQTYMFVAEKENGKLFLLMGGHIKTLEHQSLQYYYETMLNYSESVRLFVSDYLAFQKRVSEEIKQFGGDGRIHGCIVDIDFFNHVYINPLDGKISAYSAASMVDKYFFENLPSLLNSQCPTLYRNYSKLIREHSKDQSLPIPYKNDRLSSKVQYEPSTEMYRASRVLLKLQKIVDKKVIQIWNDEMAETPSKEIGRLITKNLLESATKRK